MAKTNPQQIKLQLGEFGLIAKYFAPLAKSPGALELLDDGAIIALEPDQELVTTTDMLISGVHFMAQAEPEEIAARLLAVNVSDLAAMGAKPLGYLLVTAFTGKQDDSWLSRFAKQLDQDQTRYGMILLGGDTVATPGPLSLTLTAFGTIPKGQALLRSQAKPGENIYVSGTIGDGALGLQALKGQLPEIEEQHRNELIKKFQYPQPRVELGQSLRGIVGGIADISDGLLADLGHICETSNCGATVLTSDIPLSNAAKAVLAIDDSYINAVLTGGDDYELVFTARSESRPQIDQLAKSSGLQLSCIGEITDGTKVTVIDSNNNILPLKTKGYEHF